MFSFARFLSGLNFIVLGLSQVYYFKAVDEAILSHFELLIDSTTTAFHVIYLFFCRLTPFLMVAGVFCQIFIGISILFSYRLRLIGRLAFVLWFLWALIYYPFYAIEGKKLTMLGDFCFSFFQCIIILFCISPKKNSARREVGS